MDGIFEVEGILSENDCDRIIEVYNENFKYAEPGRIGVQGMSRIENQIKDTMDMYLPIEGEPATYSAQRILHDACHRTFKKYLDHFRDHGLDRGTHDIPSVLETYTHGFLSSPQIQKVKLGGRFNWHSDCAPNHVIQYIFYLNDNYEGGRTEFSNGRIIEPKKGKVVIVPCTPQALHRGNMVKHGIKYISAVYLYNKKDH